MTNFRSHLFSHTPYWYVVDMCDTEIIGGVVRKAGTIGKLWETRLYCCSPYSGAHSPVWIKAAELTISEAVLDEALSLMAAPRTCFSTAP